MEKGTAYKAVAISSIYITLSLRSTYVQLTSRHLTSFNSPVSTMASHENVDLVPGTEIMKEDGKAKKVLIPQPSSDPHDPLNWSTTWKRQFPFATSNGNL
jgi:hypothetical protein